jgi:hypothetical protein
MSGQKNSGNRGAKKESGVEKKNNRFVTNILDDLRSDEGLDQIRIARVLKKFGNGRVEVFFVKTVKGIEYPTVAQAVIRGSFRGRGKRSVWIDIGSIVVLADVGLAGSAEFEIVAVLSSGQIHEIKKEMTIDPRILAVDAVDTTKLMSGEALTEGGFEFDYGTVPAEPEIDVDAI